MNEDLTPPTSDLQSGLPVEPANLALGFAFASDKVRTFPITPGVYLMKDRLGRVIYIGKAKNLRSRASSYFLKAASEDERTADWINEIVDIDFVGCDSEVDALLTEARLIKDIQPKHNRDLKDDKTFPYLMISTREDFPRVEVTREPRQKGVKLYGPFTSAGALQISDPLPGQQAGSKPTPFFIVLNDVERTSTKLENPLHHLDRPS